MKTGATEYAIASAVYTSTASWITKAGEYKCTRERVQVLVHWLRVENVLLDEWFPEGKIPLAKLNTAIPPKYWKVVNVSLTGHVTRMLNCIIDTTEIRSSQHKTFLSVAKCKEADLATDRNGRKSLKSIFSLSLSWTNVL